MRIALCYGNKEILGKLKKIIYLYAEFKRLDIVAECYVYGEDIIESEVEYDIIFLGYTLNGENGFEVAKTLRSKGMFSAIIFITDYVDFVFDSFKVAPYRFLVTPIEEKVIFDVLDDFLDGLDRHHYFSVKSGKDIFCLNTSEIFYLAADNKHCLIHIREQSVICKRTMAKIYTEMPKSHFVKIHRAFIVNLDYITKYNSDFLTLTNGEKLYISRNYLKDFKTRYRRFLNCQCQHEREKTRMP